MVRIARWEVLLSLVCTLVVGVLLGTAMANPTVPIRSHYLLVDGPETAPYRVALRGCTAEDDFGAGLRLVRYDPERVVLVCRAH